MIGGRELNLCDCSEPAETHTMQRLGTRELQSESATLLLQAASTGKAHDRIELRGSTLTRPRISAVRALGTRAAAGHRALSRRRPSSSVVPRVTATATRAARRPAAAHACRYLATHTHTRPRDERARARARDLKVSQHVLAIFVRTRVSVKCSVEE